jgi:hypothetical protein
MHQPVRFIAAIAAVAFAVAACGSGSDGTAGASAGGEKVTITSPSDGATVDIPFKLKWNSTVPLGPTDSGKDHVHVYVDGQTNDYTVVGGTEFQVKGLSPGKHTVEISLQHADHSPVGPKSQISVMVGGSGGSQSPSEGGSGGNGY